MAAKTKLPKLAPKLPLTDEQIDHIIELVVNNTECASQTCTSHVTNDLFGTLMEVKHYLKEEFQ